MGAGGGIKVGGHLKLMMMSEREKKRKIERRMAALWKQAKELCVLCDVEIGIVMFGPRDEEGPIVWPSVEVAMNRFLAFWGLPEAERGKKMATYERFLRDWVNGEMEKLRKKEEEVERKEMNAVMKEIIQGKRRLGEMDARQLSGLYALAGEKMKELEKRKQDLLQLRQNHHGGAAATAVPPPPPPTAAADSAPSWFIPPAMAAPEGSHHQMIFSDGAVGSSSTNNGGGGNYGHQLPDFDQVWPYNFSSSF